MSPADGTDVDGADPDDVLRRPAATGGWHVEGAEPPYVIAQPRGHAEHEHRRFDGQIVVMLTEARVVRRLRLHAPSTTAARSTTTSGNADVLDPRRSRPGPDGRWLQVQYPKGVDLDASTDDGVPRRVSAARCRGAPADSAPERLVETAPSRLARTPGPDEGTSMGLLEQVTSPADLRDLTDAQLEALASEIRDELVRTCAPRGGHLGPNLGVVELTLAIHRIFDSPRDRVVWDTGHQAYVHKMLTGRADPVRHPAHRGRPVRLPEPGRVRARHRRELPRLHRRCPTPTAWPRPTRCAARTATSSP